MFGRKKVAMLVAEFLGTGVLTLVVLAVQRSTIGISYFVALAAGLAVGAMSLLLASASGAHFNPALTIGAWSARRVKTMPAVTYLVVQLLGGWAAYGLYRYFVNSGFQSIGTHNTVMRVVVAEGVGALIFAFGWAAIAAQRLAASLAGVVLALGILVASIASLGLINPAVATGTRAWAVFGGWQGWWAYFVGPVVGAAVGYNLYEFVFGNSAWLARPANRRVAVPAATTKRSAAKKPAARRRK